MNEEEKEVAEEEEPRQPADESEEPAGEAADRDPMRRYVKLPAKYEGRCRGCKGMIRVGEAMVWDTREKKTYCPECGMEKMGVDEEDD